MADLDLNERELATGAAIAMQTIREDRRDQAAEAARQRISSRTAWFSGIFVIVSSIGMLALMLYMSPT